MVTFSSNKPPIISMKSIKSSALGKNKSEKTEEDEINEQTVSDARKKEEAKLKLKQDEEEFHNLYLQKYHKFQRKLKNIE